MAWTDSLSTQRGIVTITVSISDALELLSDSLSSKLTYAAALSADSMAAWDDTPAGVITHDASLTSDWSNLDDAPAGFLTYSVAHTDDLDDWADSFDFDLVDLAATPIEVSPDADSMAEWDDTLAGIESHDPAITDDWSNLSDATTPALNYYASPDADDFNAWDDSLDFDLPSVAATPLTYSASDTFALWDDTPDGMMSHDGSIIDDWSNLSDLLGLKLESTTGGMVGVLDAYIIVGLNQAGNQGPSIGAM